MEDPGQSGTGGTLSKVEVNCKSRLKIIEPIEVDELCSGTGSGSHTDQPCRLAHFPDGSLPLPYLVPSTFLPTRVQLPTQFNGMDGNETDTCE
jgi:hypothetical protein